MIIQIDPFSVIFAGEHKPFFCIIDVFVVLRPLHEGFIIIHFTHFFCYLCDTPVVIGIF